MTEKARWHKAMMEPGLMRTSTILLLIAWGLTALWSWVLVEPTVLRNNEAARNYVAWATTWFPWLTQLQILGPQAEKGLFLHSVYWVLMAPFGLLSGVASVFRSETQASIRRDAPLRVFLEVAVCAAIFAFGLWCMYFYILKPSDGELHRTGYSFAISSIGVPLTAPGFIAGFWATAALSMTLLLAGIRRSGTK